MKFLAIALALMLPTLSPAQNKDTRLFELRIYYCNPGKLDALVQRFTNHTAGLFEKHGMENVGYWLPTNNTENALYYILAYPGKAARDASWKAFGSDPAWQAARDKSEENGKIVAKVSSTFMNASDISPAIKAGVLNPERLFELRTYYILPGRIKEIEKRFQDHTIGLLSKQGISHIGYWTTVETEGAEPKLVYILAHSSEEKAKKSWEAFRADPVWIKAKAESEKDHPIVEKVESVMMKPMTISKIK